MPDLTFIGLIFPYAHECQNRQSPYKLHLLPTQLPGSTDLSVVQPFLPYDRNRCKGKKLPKQMPRWDRSPQEYRKIVRRLPKHQTSCCTAIAEPIINRRINRFEEIFKIWNIGSSDNKRYRIKTTKINRCRPKQPFSGVVTKSGYPQNNQREPTGYNKLLHCQTKVRGGKHRTAKEHLPLFLPGIDSQWNRTVWTGK